MWRTALLVSAALVTLSCDDVLPPGDKSTPDYWADYFLDKYADELVVGELEAGPPALQEPRYVLLITGVTIRAQWFDPIVARLTRDGFIPVVYEPPDLLSYDLFEASHDLADVVEQVLEESGQERIDILAECTGGVIARYYVQSLGGHETVSRMVTFVSPQHGVDKAPLAALYANWPALRDLTPGSEFLTAVNEAPLPPEVAFTSIYTCSDEYIRPYETSIIPGANNIGLCDEFVGHFQTFYDPAIYEIMYGALTEPTIHDTPGGGDDEEPEGEPEVDDPIVIVGDPVFGDGDPFEADDEPIGGPAQPDLAGNAPTIVEVDSEPAPVMGCSTVGGAGSWPVLAALGLLCALALGPRRRPRRKLGAATDSPPLVAKTGGRTALSAP